MGIYGQPNSWQCGPFALKHALLSYGLFAHEDELARIAGSSEVRGTDEKGLHRAARRFGCELQVVRCTTARAAERELERWLTAGIPVLLCVDQWDHWITAMSAGRGEIVMFDSHYDQPLRIEPSDVVLERLTYRERRWGGVWQRTLFDVQPLLHNGNGLQLRLTPADAAFLLRPENAELVRRFDELARVVVQLAAPAGAQLEFGHALDRFIAVRRDDLVERAAAMARVDQASAFRCADQLAFVARAYRAVLRPDNEAPAIGAIASLLAARAPAPTPVQQVREGQAGRRVAVVCS